MFSNGEATLGVPSLWVWQVVFWLSGVLLTWWLAYPVGLSVIAGEGTPAWRWMRCPGRWRAAACPAGSPAVWRGSPRERDRTLQSLEVSR